MGGMGVGWVPVAVLVAMHTVRPRPCDGRRPSSLLAQAPPRVCANTYTLHRPPTAACAKGPGADVGKQEALPFGATVVGVGAHRACQRDDEDGPKHVHESCEASVGTTKRTRRQRCLDAEGTLVH